MFSVRDWMTKMHFVMIKVFLIQYAVKFSFAVSLPLCACIIMSGTSVFFHDILNGKLQTNTLCDRACQCEWNISAVILHHKITQTHTHLSTYLFVCLLNFAGDWVKCLVEMLQTADARNDVTHCQRLTPVPDNTSHTTIQALLCELHQWRSFSQRA